MRPIPSDPTFEPAPLPLPHWGRWIGGVVVLVLFGAIVYTFLSSPKIRWDAIGVYLFSPRILDGLWMTIRLTVICMAIGIVLGTLAALMRISENPIMRWVSWFYVWFFRGTPQLVQIIFWFNIGLFLPRIGWGEWSVNTNDVITSFTAAVLALGLNQGAYMAEVVRAGLLSIDPGQIAAARALGMKGSQTTTLVVLPQAMKVILPPTGNELISLLKSTSLVSAIAAKDLLNQAQGIYQETFLVIELLLVASIWYLVLTSLATVGQHYLERYIAGSGKQKNEQKLSARIAHNLVPGKSRDAK